MRAPQLRAAAGLLLALAIFVVPVLPAAGQASLQGTITVSTANIRSGPGVNYAVIAQARAGAVFNLVGRNAANTWWVICCINNRQGWISNTVATASGNTAVLPIIDTAAPQPPPPPTPPPAQSFPDWKGEYFNDINLQGPPLLVRNDPRIDFAWNLDSPDPSVPADNFSVRWTRSVNFPAGNWAFFARTSDGVRVWVDTI
ncbi:MAG: PA14 domain-containing protein [Anaerolineae bacterium]|nr:PA14 domain-containing protein [Anaerolineae bacterium]